MIKSFRNKHARDIWNEGGSRKIPTQIVHLAFRKMIMLDAATTLQDLVACKSNCLEKRKGVRDTYTIRINEQYRVRFVWKQGDAYDVEVGDFHA